MGSVELLPPQTAAVVVYRLAVLAVTGSCYEHVLRVAELQVVLQVELQVVLQVEAEFLVQKSGTLL